MAASEVSAKRIGFLDKLGSCVSFACAIHCLAIPLVVTFLPLIGLSFLKESSFEIGMIIFAVTLAALSLCWGVRIHGEKKTLGLVLAALIFFLSGHAFDDSAAHWVFMAFGGFCLVGGHLLNRKLCKSCLACEHSH